MNERLTHWNGEKYLLPQGRTSNNESYWRLIAEKLAEYENNGPPTHIDHLIIPLSFGQFEIYKSEPISLNYDEPTISIYLKTNKLRQCLTTIAWNPWKNRIETTVYYVNLYGSQQSKEVIPHRIVDNNHTSSNNIPDKNQFYLNTPIGQLWVHMQENENTIYVDFIDKKGKNLGTLTTVVTITPDINKPEIYTYTYDTDEPKQSHRIRHI